MRTFLNRFILEIPLLYIKQFPYAWIAFIAFWVWPPDVSWVFLLVVLIGLLMVVWRHSAWLSTLRKEYASGDAKFYVDRPRVPLRRAVQNISILLVLAGGISFFLNKQIGLTAWQVFLIITGFSLLYRDSLFFGALTTYVITDGGIGLYFAPGHLDYRLFIKFNEIGRVERCGYQKDKGWDCFARIPSQDGLLLLPKNPNGLTKRMEKLFIVPENIEKFLAQLPRQLQP